MRRAGRLQNRQTNEEDNGNRAPRRRRRHWWRFAPCSTLQSIQSASRNQASTKDVPRARWCIDTFVRSVCACIDRYLLFFAHKYCMCVCEIHFTIKSDQGTYVRHQCKRKTSTAMINAITFGEGEIFHRMWRMSAIDAILWNHPASSYKYESKKRVINCLTSLLNQYKYLNLLSLDYQHWAPIVSHSRAPNTQISCHKGF